MQLDRAIDLYLQSKRAEGKTEATIRTYTDHLFRFAKDMPEIEEVSDIDKYSLQGYIAKLQARPTLKAVSVNSRVRSLRGFCSWLYEEELLRSNPFRTERGRLKMPKFEQEVPETLSDIDFRKLLATCDRSTNRGRRDEAILMFLFDTGVRVGELVNIQRERLDTRNRRAVVMGKGRKERNVFFSPQTAVALTRYLTRMGDRAWVESEWVFMGWRGRRMTTYGVNQMLDRRAKEAGVTARCNPHTFRHTFATNYLRMGGDPATLQRILGHSDISTTVRIYTHLVGDDLAKAHDQFSPMQRALGRK